MRWLECLCFFVAYRVVLAGVTSLLLCPTGKKRSRYIFIQQSDMLTLSCGMLEFVFVFNRYYPE